MAESKSTMVRLDRLERESKEFKRALVQITDILVDQSERIDHVSKRVDELGRTLGARIDDLGSTLGGRLDRLIAVTTQERTYSVERIADIERRLSKLEERSGI
jgi:hypothetical protein